MPFNLSRSLFLAALLACGSFSVVSPRPAFAWPPNPQLGNKNAPKARLHIEVTAGDANEPVAGASVYVKFETAPKSKTKFKQAELNLKTTQEGFADSPPVLQGKVLIQVIAQGWKTYGEWYDVQQTEQTIRIHLLPAPKWY